MKGLGGLVCYVIEMALQNKTGHQVTVLEGSSFSCCPVIVLTVKCNLSHQTHVMAAFIKTGYEMYSQRNNYDTLARTCHRKWD